MGHEDFETIRGTDINSGADETALDPSVDPFDAGVFASASVQGELVSVLVEGDALPDRESAEEGDLDALVVTMDRERLRILETAVAKRGLQVIEKPVMGIADNLLDREDVGFDTP